MTMNISNAPSWFALSILLQGVRFRPDVASCKAHWSSLLIPGENLLCRLEAEFSAGYSGDPPEDIPKVIRELVQQLHSLGNDPLRGKPLSQFIEHAESALREASLHLGAGMNLP